MPFKMMIVNQIFIRSNIRVRRGYRLLQSYSCDFFLIFFIEFFNIFLILNQLIFHLHSLFNPRALFIKYIYCLLCTTYKISQFLHLNLITFQLIYLSFKIKL